MKTPGFRLLREISHELKNHYRFQASAIGALHVDAALDMGATIDTSAAGGPKPLAAQTMVQA